MHRFRARTMATVVLISICVVGTGCTTTRTLPVPHAASEILSGGIKPGSKVRVTLRSGEMQTFRLTAIEPDALVGKDFRIPFSDIAKLQEMKVGIGRSIGLAVGVAVVLAGAAVAYIVESERGSD